MHIKDEFVKYAIPFLLLVFTSLTFAQDAEYFDLYESYAAADAAKYHDILQSIESGNIEEAKKKLLGYQAAEILVLEKMKEDRKIRTSSDKIIKMVRKYNDKYSD